MAIPDPDIIARLTEQFDFHDPHYTPDVAETVNREIREKAAVTYSPAHGGMWILSRYEDVKAALKDHATFSSGSGVHFPRAPGMPKFAPIDFDPPEHGGIRKLMSPPVRGDQVRRLEPDIRKLAADLIAPIAERGHGDLVAEFARPFAVGVLGLLIGLSEQAQGEIRGLTRTLWKHLSTDSDAEKFWPAYHAVLAEEVRRARARPDDSYLSWLANHTVDGEHLPDEQLYSIIVSYCIAGHDNTMNTVSRILWHLAGDPDLQRRLKDEPELMPGVAEETLRRWCPTDRFTRVTTRDVTIGGTTIPRGARVVLLFDAANRDPKEFGSPDDFDPRRGNAHHHLSFGHGIHHCVGAQLARLEFRIVLEELARHPVYRLSERSQTYFENGRHIMFDKIAVRFDRPPAPGLDRLMGITTGLWESQALVAATDLGLFGFLAECGGEGADADTVADNLGIERRPAEVLLTACASLGLLRLSGDGYANAPVADHYLVPGKPDYLGDYVGMLQTYVYPGWMRVTEAVRTNTPSRVIPQPGKEIFDAENRPTLFWRGLHPLSALTGRALAAGVDLPGATRLLDVGGGSGAFAIELCRGNPRLRATVFDLPHVCAIAGQRIREAGLEDRIGTLQGDFFQDAELPGGHDTILLSMVLHDWDEPRNRELLAKCYRALPAGGTVVISELLVNADKTGPVDAALMSLNMIVGTPGRNYTAREYERWLRDAGFDDIRTVEFQGPAANGAVLARKPGGVSVGYSA
ncbi:cytochrome P450 [Nocardiopsis rhodophaea]|uniref:cytochrome P450 n=1 Tax=Nocardiopsis rhodophaea TaxID=280238 RepID=UPI0031D65906